MKQKDWNFNKQENVLQHMLYLLPRPIFPIISGYSNKNYYLLPALAKQYQLHLVLLSDKELSTEELEFYKNNHIWVTCFLFTKTDHIKGAVLSLFNGEPIQVGYYYNRRVQKYLNTHLSAGTIAVAGLIRTAKYLLSSDVSGQYSLDMVDSIGMNYQRSAGTTSSFLWKRLYSVEAKRLLRYEKEAVERFSVSFLINQQEEEAYRPFGKTKWLPHGVKPELLTYTKTNPQFRNAVAFIGKMNYQPNVDAMKWYIENVHSKIGNSIPLIIAGALPTREIQDLAKACPNILLTGYCEDPYIYLNSAFAVIAPMQSGGGIQNKVLESMALGKVTVLTSLAAEAISYAVSGEHFLIADDAEEYCCILPDIQQQPEKYQEIGIAAQSLIKKIYSWENYCSSYIRTLQEVSGSKQRDNGQS